MTMRYTKTLLTISNYRATMSCESKALALSDDLVVSAPPLCRPRLCVSFFDLFLATVNSSRSTLRLVTFLDAASTLTPLFAALTKNTRGGVSSSSQIFTQLHSFEYGTRLIRYPDFTPVTT